MERAQPVNQPEIEFYFQPMMIFLDERFSRQLNLMVDAKARLFMER
jgi:hypothetical protein